MVLKNNVKDRIRLFILFVPVFVGLFLMPPWYEHLFIHVVLIILPIALGAREMSLMLQRLHFPVRPFWALCIGFALPTTYYLELVFEGLKTQNIFSLSFTAIGLFSFILPVFCFRLTMQQRLSVSIGYLLITFYPTYLGTYFSGILSYDSGTYPYFFLFYVLSVWMNDFFAWLLGILFGKKKSGGYVDVSPNKTIEGFIGGMVASIGLFLVYAYCFPELIRPRWALLIGIGFVISLVSIFGDLVESMIKRASGVKDSGTILPGRGGMLDSIDSLLFAAPVFYYTLPLLKV